MRFAKDIYLLTLLFLSSVCALQSAPIHLLPGYSSTSFPSSFAQKRQASGLSMDSQPSKEESISKKNTICNGAKQAQPKRIICLSGAITETVRALGMGKNIVAVDVTSVWPQEVERLPKVSRNRSVSAEGIISFRPDLVIVPEGDISREVLAQLQSVGIRVAQVRQEYSVNGASGFIRKVASSLGCKELGETLVKKTETNIQTALNQRKRGKTPKILFIYARGTGTMSVAGKGSSLDAIIHLAGGKNAIQDFSDFKPYTTEALVKANPDIILLFDFGLSSLGGKDAVLRMPGVSFTNAGKNKRIVEMDGPLLVNFSTRLPDAIKELNNRIF